MKENGYITTYTGKHIWPLESQAADIDIQDIAHALSLTCRGNGQVRTFFSVGQHCIWCAKEAEARGYSRRLILACLLHDASECYLTDLPRPLKAVMPEYVEIEDRLLQVIYRKYLGGDLTSEEEALLKQVDDDLLYYDLRELLGVAVSEEAPRIHVVLDYSFRPFAEVEEEYLSLFERFRDVSKDAVADLDALTKTFSEAADGFMSFYHIPTGEIVTLPNPYNAFVEWTPEDRQLQEKIDTTQEYLRLPNQLDLDEREIMEAFAQTVSNEHMGQYLARVLAMRKPFHKFRDAIGEMGLQEAYEEFRMDSFRKKARRWCQERNVPFEGQ